MNEKQIEKKAQREADRLDQFQQRKQTEELTNGMALRNAALEQLAHKIKEEEIITSLHKLQETKRRLGLPNVLNKISIPPVPCVILDPSHSKHPTPSKRKSQMIVKSASATQNSCAQRSERSELMNWPELVWQTILPGSAAQWLF